MAKIIDSAESIRYALAYIPQTNADVAVTTNEMVKLSDPVHVWLHRRYLCRSSVLEPVSRYWPGVSPVSFLNWLLK